MQRRTPALIALVSGLLCSAALGQEWFTDDFDSYLIGTCDVDPYCDCEADNAAFQAAWQPGPNSNVGAIGTNGGCPSGFWGWDPPFSWEGKKSAPFQAVRSLLPAIQAASGDPLMNAVNGTDEQPLEVEFHLYAKAGKQGLTALWLELFAGTPEAMMAPTSAPGISACTDGVCAGGPSDGLACTVDEDCTAMKLERTGGTGDCVLQNNTPSVPRPALAYGIYGGYNGLIPKPPCGNINNRGLGRPVLFNGDAWWTLGPDSPPGATGDDLPNADLATTIVLTIRETDMDILLVAPRASSCANNDGTCDLLSSTCVGGVNAGLACASDTECMDVHTCSGGAHDGDACTLNSDCTTFFKTTIPRLYTGPFQMIGIGPGDINDGNNANAPYSGSEFPGYVDDISIQGGVFVSLPTGACCQPLDGSCIDGVIEAACTQQGGSWAGADTTCDTYNCLGPAGACCLPDTSCTDGIDEVACLALGGRYDGAFTTCSDPDLPVCCPNPFADSDLDGDVDMVDFGRFQTCLGVDGTPAPEGCDCFDRDGDGDVDEADFGNATAPTPNTFIGCVSGAGIPADTACDGAP